jgi:hypothetical protein
VNQFPLVLLLVQLLVQVVLLLQVVMYYKELYLEELLVV